ncbi:response regulator [Rhizobium sp. R693]|uniref:response regulator n=1 Tax=Rhizobium sp. R693 TaxID=1764276 RepID=UPI000B533F9C|nr:response regulator [Rhizobium sp. R693]OWV99516.1 hybrid sensor histidine kinase/response regulator [Rhizobium sp. R693]
MTSNGDLLELACRRIADLDRPAYVKNSELRYVAVNEAYASFFGKEISDFIGRRSRELIDTPEEETREDKERRALVFASEESAVCFDSSGAEHERVRIESFSPSEDRVYVLGIFERRAPRRDGGRQPASNLARSQALSEDLHNILRALPVGVMILDDMRNVLYANDEFYDVWDLPCDNRFDGWAFIDVIRHNHKLGRYGAKVTPEQVLARREAHFQAAEREQRPVELGWVGGKRVLFDGRSLSNGRVLLSYADVTAVREREKEVHETRAALEHMGDLMHDATRAMSQGLLIVQDGIILLASDPLSDILAIPPEYLAVGRGWIDLFRFCAERGDFHGQEDEILTSWRDNIAAKKPISTPFHVAGERWVNLDATISERQHWIALFTDVTEAKEREAELERLLSRAEAADRVKSEFLANMSHEIRTPMNGVLGMAELLAKTDLDTRQKTFIDIIVKSGNALVTIINDILDFSKIDAGQMTLRRTTFDLVDAIEDVATLLSSPAAEKNIELLVRTAPDLPSAVIGDAGRFRQIITNLVGNAVKFTERGHVLVDIGFAPGAQDEIMASIRVEDTGIGIPDDKLESIFDKFSQIDASSTRRHEGTGLGLAITAGLVDLFGGYLEVDSQPGEGSVFTVNLPFVVAAARLAPKPLPVNVRGAHVLVVDDNAVNRQILTEQLALWGFDGAAAEDGPAAFAIIEAAHEFGLGIDAIVLDYQIPGMNGAEIARKLRTDSRFERLPIIFLTSMDIAGTEKEFAALNGQAYLMKPARANVLRNTIADVVRASRTKQVAAAAIMQSSAEAMPSPLSKAQPSETAPTEFIDVLVAEDNEVNQIVFTQILLESGRSFLVVGNGQEAVEAWHRHTPRIIMMDVSMPVMNGHDATRAIRDQERGQGHRVPIVGVTAHALEADRDLCLEAGMDDYMSKPISPELLEEKLELWLGRNGRQTGQSASHR